MEMGLVIMLGTGYIGPVHIRCGHILLVSVSLSVSMSGSANEPLQMVKKVQRKLLVVIKLQNIAVNGFGAY